MADAPQLLLAPESRKDKISKNDMRYLYRLQKGKQRSRKRAAVDKEIRSEKQTAEKRRRLSNANGEIKKLRKVVSKLRGLGTGSESTAKNSRTRTKKSPEQVMLEESMSVYEGDVNIPCVFDLPTNVPPKKDDDFYMNLKDDAEILAYDPQAIIWREIEYSNIIPHPNLWVLCCKCKSVMPSNEIGYTQQTNWSTPLCKESQELTDFKIASNIKWRLYHKTCWLLSQKFDEESDEERND